MRGASEESINALPKHKFQLKRNGSSSSRDSSAGVDEGGVVAAGTEKERAISGEDAVSFIIIRYYFHNLITKWILVYFFFLTISTKLSVDVHLQLAFDPTLFCV